MRELQELLRGSEIALSENVKNADKLARAKEAFRALRQAWLTANHRSDMNAEMDALEEILSK